VIVSFKCEKLEKLWITGDASLYSSLYVYELIDILTFVDATVHPNDLAHLLNANVMEYLPRNWSVVVTVNCLEPIGSVSFNFARKHANNVDFTEYC